MSTTSTSVGTQIEAAAAPALIAALQAVQTFFTNIGTDPTKWALTVPGAATVLLGSLQLQVPTLAQAEAATLQGTVNAKLASWITSLQNLQKTA